jgi:Nitrate and nitrite sensing/Histidine kinase-, DNA gyrase B-, and HSP90-like ATPase
MRIRNWSIRAKIILLVVPPLASLLALWIFATTVLLGPALDLLDVQTNRDQASLPAAAVINDLQKERAASLTFIGAKRADPRPLTAQRRLTDKSAADFKTRATGDKMSNATDDLGRQRIRDAVNALARLTDGRQNVDRGVLDRAATFDLYTSVIDSMIRVFSSPSTDALLTRTTTTLITLGQAAELTSQEDALVNGAAAAGALGPGEPARLVAIIAAARYVYTEVGLEFVDADKAAYDELEKSGSWQRLRTLEDKLTLSARPGQALPIDVVVWRSTFATVNEELRTFEFDAAARLVVATTPHATAIFVRVIIVGVFGLLAFVLSALLTIRIGRSVVRRLTGLRQSAQSLADVRLPGVVRRLRDGDDVDVAEETPPLEFGADEIGEVGKAFQAVQRTAVESAVQEARLRRGLNEVFLNIARRSQTLLHRQLSMLDKMERAAEADELEDLFRIDHLATRMRRHAEDLVILAGAAPGRGWRNPVRMVDVIRGAVSEVEDYSRIELLTIPPASLVGRAVADVIHLLAEIIENATSYSPPHTQVRISGQVVPNGLVVEIEDRGLGMTADALARANERLRHPPDFDPGNSAQLGLLVVSLLAARHTIRVTLRVSPYGGVTAIVLVPPALIEKGPPALPAGLSPASTAASTLASGSASGSVSGSVVGEVTEDGLPRRRRRSSAPVELTVADADDEPAARSPEEVRDIMSSLQAGLRRGRQDAETLEDSP